MKFFIPMFFFLSYSSFSFAEIDKTINVVAFNNDRPFLFKRLVGGGESSEEIDGEENSQYLTGYSWDIFKEIFQEKGYKINLTVIEGNISDQALKKGLKFDLYLGAVRTINKEDNFYYYSLIPLYVYSVGIFSYLDHKNNLETLSKIKNFKMGMLKGSYNGKEVSKYYSSEQGGSLNMKNLLSSLVKKEVDYIVATKTNVFSTSKPMALDKSIKMNIVLSKITKHLVAPKGSKKGKILVDLFDEAMLQMKADGTLAGLMKKWNISN